MAKYRVELAPVSYKGTLYGPGDVIEAAEEEMQGFLQAGYVVKIAKTKMRSARNK